MSQIFTIENDKIVIKKLALEELEGNVVHFGSLNLSGPVEVTGELTADTIRVKNLITESSVKNATFGEWAVSDESELLGKGLNWTWGNGHVHLGYRPGNRLVITGDLDLDAGKSYMINGVAVLSENELAPQVTKSRLRELGPLKGLRVNGDALVGEFAYFNSNTQRLGLGTDEPNGNFSVAQGDLEAVISFDRDGVIEIGSYTNTDVSIITDNTSRLTFKKTGEVVFGNEVTKNADVRIYGTLTVDTVVTDNRIDRYQPLEFKTSRERGIYGQGLIWTGTGNMRQLIMMASPDRLWTTEHFDLAADRSYHINGEPVLSAVGLGSSVTQSNLSKVGTLESLTVAGEATFMERINASRTTINAKIIEFNDGSDFIISNSKIHASEKISFSVRGDEVYYADTNEIAIGNKQNPNRPVKVFGQLSVGVNNPPSDVGLAVKGNISFADRKFITGTSAPTQGSYSKGDICWNDTPAPDNYIGWVCIESGAPGRWLPFGSIARQ